MQIEWMGVQEGIMFIQSEYQFLWCFLHEKHFIQIRPLQSSSIISLFQYNTILTQSKSIYH